MTPNFIIVDDDAINNMMCKMSIARHFGRVPTHAYQIPEKALELIPHLKEPTVLFLDLNMPQMNGWDFLDRVSDFDTEVLDRLTIFILSSSTSENDRERAYAEPLVRGFITKPLTDKKLGEVFKLLPGDFGLRCFE